MGQSTNIEWTDATWNPVRGCSRVSEGCRNCYAERIASRFIDVRDPGDPIMILEPGKFRDFVERTKSGPRWTGKVQLIDSKLHEPLHWKQPRRVFVNSMSDLFHEALSIDDIAHVFATMAEARQHTFQILTKRAERLPSVVKAIEGRIRLAWEAFDAGSFPWPLPNVWLGVSVEDQKTADERILFLRRTPAAVRFVSYEPALGPLDLSRHMWPVHWHWSAQYRSPEEALAAGAYAKKKRQALVSADAEFIDWIIVGGESGPGARPFNIAWARNVIGQCKDAEVACFVKQLGADPYFEASANENLLDRVWPHSPQFPQHDGQIRTKLRDKKGGDWNEWPADLHIREFPEAKQYASA
jgi:protein gp37